MKSNLLSVAIIFTALFSFFNADAQETKSILQNEKQIVYKITGFTAETNKKNQE